MHRSVLLQETIEGMQLKEGDLAIDSTCGAGGHTALMAERVGLRGKVLAIDRDKDALLLASNIFRGENVTFVKGEMVNIERLARDNGFAKVDAVLADLGVSSMQLDDPARGFSLKSRGVLDMRMDKSQELSALEVVNGYSEDELARIFYLYGEESKSRIIARAIVKVRKNRPITDTDQLSEVVRVIKGKALKKNAKLPFKKYYVNPATKIFQAIRIEVNQELRQLELALPQMVSLLRRKGRLAIISFHSLEDRIVKRFFKEMAKACICPPEYLSCTCDHKMKLRVITKKPIVPSTNELAKNPRSRSAKLRIAEKI